MHLPCSFDVRMRLSPDSVAHAGTPVSDHPIASKLRGGAHLLE